MNTTYDQNSIVDVLRQMGKPTDVASRAQMAMDMKITPDAATYISKASTGSNANENTALIAALKGLNKSSAPAVGGTVTTPTAPTTTQGTAPVTPTQPTIGTPAIGSMQYDLAHGLAPGTSSQAGYKAPAPQDQNGGTVLNGVNQLLGNVAKPTVMDQAAKDEEAKAARDKTEQALLSAYAPQLNALTEAMNNELGANDDEAKDREQAMLQNLAVRGILNVSSEDPAIRKKYYAGEAKISSAIRDKYTLQRMAILGKIGDDAYKAGVKRAEDIIANEKTAMEMYYKELEGQRDTYKLLSDEQISNKQLELEREKTAIDKKYKEGSLTIDQYNSETNRIKAESDKLVNAAQVKKLNAETTKLGAETSALGGTANPAKTADQIKFLKDVATKASNLSTASGPSGISKMAGDFFVGDTEFRQLEQYTDTLKTNLLTLMADPTIKKFFGPQMTNRDVELMTSAGTTLNAEKNSPEQMKTEIGRITDLLGRMEASVAGKTETPSNQTPATNQSVNTTYEANGTIYELGADGKYYPKK